MINRKRLLAVTVSGVALACAAGPVLAADANDASTVGEVVVTGIRASLEKAIELKRINENQIDAISSEDIGKLPDKNIADALQRIPGLNTESAASGEGGFDENDRVSIRGTSPSLTQVTIDGHEVSTGDWFILDQFQTVGRSVSFDLLPAEMVQNIEVYKTQDASLLEGGVAGAIDIQTRKPLELKKSITIEGTAQGAYNTNSGETKPELNGLLGWKNADDTFGVIVQGFYEQRSVRRYGQETLGYTAITSAMPIGAANPSLVGVQAPTLIGSTLFEQEKTREGVTGAIEWRPDSKVEFDLSGFYSHLNASNVNNNYMYWGNNELNKNVPTSFTVANNTLTSAVWPLVGPPTTVGGVTTPGVPVDGLVVDNIIRPNERAQSYYINLDGKFQVTDHLTIKAQVGFTQGVGDTPSQPFFESDAATGISYAPSGNGWAVNPTSINPQSPAGLANDWSLNEVFRSVDKEYYGKIDGVFEVNDGLFKDVEFGGRIAEHTRQVDGWDRGCSLGTNGQCFSGGAMPFSATNPTSYPSGFNAGALGIPGLLIPIAGDPATITSIVNNITGGVRGPVSAIVQPQNYYWTGAFKVHETDIEGYVMARVGGDRWRGNFGVRLAETEENAFVNVPTCTPGPGCTAPPGQTVITTSAYGPYYADDVRNNYLDVLPSVNFTFDLQKNLLLRFSAAETMSRPDFSALGGTVSLTDLTDVGNGGNPNLKPIRAAVYDAALEWYYAPTAVAAVSVFHDDLQSYVTFGTSSNTYYNMLNKDFETFNISSPSNIGGELSGFELQVQQPIAWGFGFQANGTYVDGHDDLGNPLVGTSKLTFNLVGYYENKWVSARLAYTYRSHYFVGLDRSSDENQENYGTLDGSLDFNITPNIALTLDALNITNNRLKYYAANPTQIRAVYDNGTQVFFGLRAKF